MSDDYARDGRWMLNPPPPMAVHECGATREIRGKEQVCLDETGHEGWHESLHWRWSDTSEAAMPAFRWYTPAAWYERETGVERAPERTADQ